MIDGMSDEMKSEAAYDRDRLQRHIHAQQQ
jgi:hypothetical protein